MSFLNNEEIMLRLQDHYKIAKNILKSDDKIIAIILRGSQNYGLDSATSDIDSWCIYCPSKNERNNFPDYGLDKKEFALSNGEQIAVVDIYRFFYGLTKRSLFYIELLYSQWYIIDTKYETIWKKLVLMADEIIAKNKPALATSLNYYISTNITHVSDKKYPSRIEAIYNTGYDAKALYTAVRQYLCLKLLTTDYPFKYSMHPTFNFLAKDAKMGNYDALTAQRLIRFISADIDRLYKEICTNYPVCQKEETLIINKLQELKEEIINVIDYGESLSTLSGSS